MRVTCEMITNGHIESMATCKGKADKEIVNPHTGKVRRRDGRRRRGSTRLVGFLSGESESQSERKGECKKWTATASGRKDERQNGQGTTARFVVRRSGERAYKRKEGEKTGPQMPP